MSNSVAEARYHLFSGAMMKMKIISFSSPCFLSSLPSWCYREVQSPVGGQQIVVCSKGQYWFQSCLTPSLMIWMYRVCTKQVFKLCKTGTGTGSPETLLNLYPCRYSKAIWTQSWTTCCRWLCLNRSVEQGDFQLEPFCDSAVL